MMSRELMTKSLAEAADAAGYAMASGEEDQADWARRHPEFALRNGHVKAANAARRMSLPFARFEHWVTHMLSLSDLRAHAPRALLPSR